MVTTTAEAETWVEGFTAEECAEAQSRRAAWWGRSTWLDAMSSQQQLGPIIG